MWKYTRVPKENLAFLSGKRHTISYFPGRESNPGCNGDRRVCKPLHMSVKRIKHIPSGVLLTGFLLHAASSSAKIES